jgi:restriction system protein
MAINVSTEEFYESLTEIVGIKSGLVLDRRDVIALLKEDEQMEEYAKLKRRSGLRIRSEVYEDVIEYLLFRVGRLERRFNPPPGVAVFHKYKRNRRLHKIAQGVGEQFTAFLEAVANDPEAKSIDPTSLVNDAEAKYGVQGALIALEYVDSLHAYMVRSPWGRPTSEYQNAIELKDLFESEGLEPLYGKFIDQRYIDYLHRNFERIDEINWRKFEGLTGEFFDREGFHVDLGPGRNDDGVDVRLWPKNPEANEPPTVLVQCKRQKAAIEKVVVKALYADVLSEKATSGLIVTTSRLSVGSAKLLQVRDYPIQQADRETLKQWVANLRKPGAGWYVD